MKDITGAEFRVLRERTRTDLAEPSNVSALADHLGVSASYVSQTFAKLHAKGWVERRTRATTRGRVVEYEPVEGLEVRWVQPDERVAIRWDCRGAIDWEFPLTTQIPDETARKIVVAFLRALRNEGILDGNREKGHVGLAVVVYGSSARGDARRGSDVDLLVFEAAKSSWLRAERPPQASVASRVGDIAADVSLKSPRSIQAHVLDVADVHTLPTWIGEAVQHEGAVVHDGARARWSDGGFRLFQWVYADRPEEASG